MSSKIFYLPSCENLEKSIAFTKDAFGFEEKHGKISQTTSSLSCTRPAWRYELELT